MERIFTCRNEKWLTLIEIETKTRHPNRYHDENGIKKREMRARDREKASRQAREWKKLNFMIVNSIVWYKPHYYLSFIDLYFFSYSITWQYCSRIFTDDMFILFDASLSLDDEYPRYKEGTMWPCAVQQSFWLQFECGKEKQIRIFSCMHSKYSLTIWYLAFFFE